MKNLFDFATKETSQDSMLCWIFESWEDPDCREVISDLLINFGININYDSITNITTLKQICRIDITVVIETTDKTHLLFIEDKTNSNAHTNQLLIYDSHIFGGLLKDGKHDFSALSNINSKLNKKLLLIPETNISNAKFYNFDVHRVFYKTSLITDEDKKFLTECINLPMDFSARNEANLDGWKVFSIQDICKILEPHKNNNNIVLSMYIEHIIKTYKYVNNVEMPTSKNIDEWFIYFNNVIAPYFKEKGYLVDVWNWNGRESGIGIKCINENNNYDDFDSLENEMVYVAFYNKNKDNGIIKFVFSPSVDLLIQNRETVDALKEEVKRMNDAFGTSKYPLQIKDTYMKIESKTLASAIMPVSTTEELINSLTIALNQLDYISHSLKILMY